MLKLVSNNAEHFADKASNWGNGECDVGRGKGPWFHGGPPEQSRGPPEQRDGVWEYGAPSTAG